MYTYNKNDKSYTISSDELDIEAIVNGEPEENKKTEKGETDVAGNTEDDTKNEEESHKRAKKIVSKTGIYAGLLCYTFILFFPFLPFAYMYLYKLKLV